MISCIFIITVYLVSTVGENYNITNSGWRKFCDNLPNTNITHLYVSEHVIDIDLKNKMRDYIRMNRTKHTLHNSVSNIRVIERCTHMWWNPVNSIRHQLETISSQRHAEDSKKREKKVEYVVTPHHTQYWAEKLTHLDDTSVVTSKRWKFACSCGETCTSYENHIYHPTGEMQIDRIGVWPWYWYWPSCIGIGLRVCLYTQSLNNSSCPSPRSHVRMYQVQRMESRGVCAGGGRE